MEFKIFDLGLVDFKKAWDFQKEVFAQVKSNIIPAALILCQHYPVITLGRRTDPKNILIKNEIPTYEIERGGDITYHGPGQLIIYPIVNLENFKKDINFYLRSLEEAVISFLSDYGIFAQRQEGLTGVWVGKEKIASIGIAIKSWITFHGVAINVKADDLANFSLIRPCGMDIKMTSMETILNRSLNLSTIRDTLSANRGTPFAPIPACLPAGRQADRGRFVPFSTKRSVA